MHSDSRRWLPARLIWRWGALLWISPLLGLVVGLVLVFGFLKENETAQVSFDASDMPRHVDVEPYLAELRSELGSDIALIKVQRHLDRDEPFLKTPLWWLRPRVKLESLEASGRNGSINMLFTHHTASGRDDLSDAFEEVAKETVPRVRAKFVEGWLAKIDARLGEIQVAYVAAEAEREIVYREDIPFIDEREDLEYDREVLLMEQPYLGCELSLAGSFLGVPPWWKSPPTWAIFVGMCTGYGLLSVFPVMIVLEVMWPRSRASE